MMPSERTDVEGNAEPREVETEQRLHERLATLENTYRAILNILEDVNAERIKLDDTRRALINILEDVETERAKGEKARVLLEASNKELESFSYSVSHDLRAPLRAISGFSAAVLEDCEKVVGEDGKRYLRLIAENAHKMGKLIDDLLNFSRLGRKQIVMAEFDMGDLARKVAQEVMADAAGRKIKFTVADVPAVRGDKAMIEQALMNLFSNAVKFTRERETALIDFGCRDDKGETVFYVKDNGVGFDMRYVDKLFGVFQRLHSVEEFEGTGVGLALVNRIITRHGGRTWAEGEVGRGATFYFTLPDSQSCDVP